MRLDKLRGVTIIELLVSLTVLSLTLMVAIYIMGVNVRFSREVLDKQAKLIAAQDRLETIIYNRDKLTLSSWEVLYNILPSFELASSADFLYAINYTYYKGNSLYIYGDAFKGLRISTRISLYDVYPELYTVTVYVYRDSLADSISLTAVVKSEYGRY